MRKDDLLKLYQTYRLYIFPAGIILASAILIIFVIYPQTVSLLDNQKVKTELAAKNNFLEVKAEELETYNNQDLVQKVTYVVTAYPPAKDYISAISVLQNIVLQSNFSVTSLVLLGDNVQDGKKSPSSSYGIKLEVSGPLQLLPQLLAKIENSPRIMRLSSIEVIPGKDPKASSASLVVDVLYSSEQGNVGSVDTPAPKLSEKDEEIIQKLAKLIPAANAQTNVSVSTPTVIGPRGKENPFE